MGNISTLDDKPAAMEGELFDLLFNTVEIRNFAPRERNEYISEMETERDRINQLAYAKKEGLKEGIKVGMEKGMEKERRATIARLLAFGMSAEDIARALDLPVEEVEKMRK